MATVKAVIAATNTLQVYDPLTQRIRSISAWPPTGGAVGALDCVSQPNTITLNGTKYEVTAVKKLTSGLRLEAGGADAFDIGIMTNSPTFRFSIIQRKKKGRVWDWDKKSCYAT